MIFKDQDFLVILAKSQVFLTRWEDQLTNCVGGGGDFEILSFPHKSEHSSPGISQS